MTIDAAIKPLENKLIVSAIDAYMHRNSFDRVGEVYIKRTSTNTGMGGYNHSRVVTITAPGADGEGGGVCTGVSDYGESPQGYTDTYGTEFANIRSRIHGALDAFRTARKYTAFDAVGNSLVDLIDKLDVRLDSKAGMGKDGLVGTIIQAEEAISGIFLGAAFDVLCRNVLPELRRGITTYWSTAGCLLANFRSEQAMMQRAEESVKSLIESATQSCDAIASKSNHGGETVVLTIISLAVSAADLASTAMTVTTPIGAARLVGSISDLGLKTLKDRDLADAAEKFFEKPGADVLAVISELENSLKKANEECRKVEEEISAALGESISEMTRAGARHKYDLNIMPHTSEEFKATDLKIENSGEAYKISDSVLPYVAQLMEKYAAELMKIQFSLPLVRGSGFALSPGGAAPKLIELQDLLYQLMMDFSNEVGDYAYNLRCAINAVLATDQESAAALARIDASAEQLWQDKKNPWARYDRK